MVEGDPAIVVVVVFNNLSCYFILFILLLKIRQTEKFYFIKSWKLQKREVGIQCIRKNKTSL